MMSRMDVEMNAGSQKTVQISRIVAVVIVVVIVVVMCDLLCCMGGEVEVSISSSSSNSLEADVLSLS